MAKGTRGGSLDPTLHDIATDELTSGTYSGKHAQLAKLMVGADTAGEQVDSGNPLPVVQTGTLALPTGAATEATLSAQSAKLPATLGQKAMAASLAVVVASDQAAVPVSGTVTATGPLTDAQLRATPVPVSGTITAITNVVHVDDNAGSLTVDYATTGSGTATGALRVELPTNGTGVIGTVGAVTAITNALPAGANAIGKLAANSGVDIGDVDITSSALPTGASTAAKQPALGTAGAASSDVITVQGIAGATPQPVVQPIVHVAQTPTVSTSPAYTAKDAVGGKLTFANVARVSGGAGVLLSVTVIDNSQQRPSLELVLFDRDFTASTDNAIFAPSDVDLANCIGVVAVNSWSDFSTNSIATVSAVGLGFVLNGTSLFGQLVTRSTPTFAATSDIVVAVKVLQS